ncbi:MAG TPA: beta-ketoacyl synthase N-terminal-like domain-containing protein [Paludibacteraceae bacterium]|nr:beta-ketoacyl synthase N-terminal-like domain-containing protein [Paludibacteraceae bacterium]HOU69192.1 beta-ketoacyl synthase N-terminal-like domain-containing protein [Paludibacteraceae bacterium]HPH62086.1 beta-ketoacyl synthase N-terminal-like domain-containing protein [Paludibacteraceae bacterium]HQF50970.1 beta-ketoacyl synthase N-terminal-like domain-containing protein [Paludibacteraceae bacterium]HQJ89619.1 beta-ketoacyl synthase N-terminal-like domain-containing protein [Paludibact
MQAYINSTGIISPQQTYDGTFFATPIVNTESMILNAMEPVYKEIINPVLLRRMSHVIKMGLGASNLCLKAAEGIRPDAVVVGTGLACLYDLEKFLLSIDDYHEKMLSPIPFINSSHNTVSSQIAIMNKLTGYNITYCHRAISFESALMDSLMLIAENEADNVLAGGIDEFLHNYYAIFNLLSYWRKETISNLSLFEGSHAGSIPGEGAAFFLLGKEKNENTLAKLIDVQTFVTKCDVSYLNNEIDNLLKRNGLQRKDVDLFLLGRNGDNQHDGIYLDLEKRLPETSCVAYFKHLCGEYMTASSFATWVAANILKTQNIPDCLIKKAPAQSQIKRILIYNHYLEKEHGLILLEAK